jgi:hypothetical protein
MASIQQPLLPGALPSAFVISTGAQRSGEISVLMPLLGNVFRQCSVRIGGDGGRKPGHVFKRLGFHATNEHGLKCVTYQQ